VHIEVRDGYTRDEIINERKCTEPTGILFGKHFDEMPSPIMLSLLTPSTGGMASYGKVSVPSVSSLLQRVSKGRFSHVSGRLAA
jgi:hypothetical protein